MSLEKAIENKKEKRKPYRGSKAFARSCRNHGNCSWCERDRLISDTKARMRLEGQEDEFFGYWNFADPFDVICDYYDEKLEKMGIDPWDFETRNELGV